MLRSSRIRIWSGLGVIACAMLVAASATASISATTPEMSDPTSTTSPTVSSQQVSERSEFEFTSSPVEFSDAFADVLVPVGTGPFPAAVTVHGGGYTRGSPALMRPMAELLARRGHVVFNTAYALSTPTRPAFPVAIDDVACAVRLAASHPDSDGTVAVIGVSAGAHAGALVALAGEDYGGDCPDTTPVKPSRLIGLGHVDVTGRNTVPPPGPDPLFMQDVDEISSSQWQAADPLNHADANPSLQALFVHAENDTITSLAAAEEMIAALADGGVAADLVVIPGIGHFEVGDAENSGEAVAEWLMTHPPG